MNESLGDFMVQASMIYTGGMIGGFLANLLCKHLKWVRMQRSGILLGPGNYTISIQKLSIPHEFSSQNLDHKNESNNPINAA